MYKVHCLNAISSKGTDQLKGNYALTEDIKAADAILVRSAVMHDLEVPDSLLCVARAGAGVNNIPLDAYAKKGIVVFNTPGANANAVKELVIAGLLMAARDIHGGMEWIETFADDENIAKDAEKAKKKFAGHEIYGKTLGVIGLGAIGVLVANAAVNLGMRVLGYDPYLSVANAWKMSRHVEYRKDLNSMLAECDYATIHVPAMDSTKGMIGVDQLICTRLSDLPDGNCRGRVKAERLHAWLDASGIVPDFTASAAYADSASDAPVLDLVVSPRLIDPSARTRRRLAGRYPILRWF